MTPRPTASSGVAADLAAWVVTCLPLLNGFAEQGCSASAIDIATAGRRLATAAVHSRPTGDMRETAILAGDIGMIVSSLLRHGVDPSSPELRELLGCLVSLSGSIDHPPRESIYTYVLWNGTEGRGMRTFTGHPLESNFICLTRDALGHYDGAAELLGKLDLAVSGAATDLDSVEIALDGVCQCYMELLEVFRSQPPDWFSAVYKPYFPAYCVGGITYDPPSGAHGAAVIELDCLLGSMTPDTAADLAPRLTYLLPADRDRVRHALEREGIASQLERNPVIHRDVLSALARVVRSFRRSSALHWALIQKLLIGPEKHGRSEPDSNQVMSYAEVRQLAVARRHPPLLSLVEKRLSNA